MQPTDETPSNPEPQSNDGRSRKDSLTAEETFWVYGLIVGMMKREGQAAIYRRDGLQTSDTPASDWEHQWQDHPYLKKARAIYLAEQEKAMTVKP